VAVVPNGVDPAEFAAPPARAISEAVRAAMVGGPYLLFLGRLTWKKNLDRLFAALARLPGARLIVAGGDDEGLRPRLEEKAHAAGLAARVRFVGEVTGADRVALLRGAHILVLPSLGENFGNAALEAMAVGVPVVLGPGVGLAEEVAKIGCGAIAAPEPQALAAVLEELLLDGRRVRALGERGRRAVTERFTWPRVAARMRAVYDEVVAG
jgi:glycosyltransferase involved in cell wall biosynthesis